MRIIFGQTIRTPKGRAKRRENVIRGILLREISGESLSAGIVKRDDHDLFISGTRCFRSWGAALRAAGIDPQVVFGTHIWTRNKVIQEIRHFQSHGIPLNYVSIQKVGHGLTHAAKKFYGSWENALRAAGQDPARIRRRVNSWTKTDIIKAMHAQADARRPISQASMCPGSIVKAAFRLYGSFRTAISAAGLTYLIKKTVCWSKTDTIKAVRQRQRAGQPLNCLSVLKSDIRLYGYARKYFGTWRQALSMARIDPAKVERKCPKWTPQTVISALRRKAMEPPACNIHSIRPTSLVAACSRFFGSLEDAAAAAQLEPSRIAPRCGTRARSFFAKQGQHDPKL